MKRHLRQRNADMILINMRTFQRCISPVSITDLHMVVPAQVTSVQIHWSKIKNDLTKRMKHRQKEREVRSRKTLPTLPFLMSFKRRLHLFDQKYIKNRNTVNYYLNKVFYF